MSTKKAEAPSEGQKIELPEENEGEDEKGDEGSVSEDLPFPLVSADAAEKALKLLIHSDPGIGKTFLIGTAADDENLRPILFIDTEGGALTIRNKMQKGVLDVVRVTSYSDMVKLITWLRRGTHPYKTIAIDSLTEMQKIIMADIMRQGAIKDNKDPDIPEMRDWGKNSERVRKIVRAFRDLPDVHVIFTTLSVDIKDDRTGLVTTKPALPGQLRNEVPGYIDVVGWLHVVVSEEKTDDKKRQKVLTRQIMFQPARNVLVKDRSASLGTIMVNPTLGDIVKKIQEG